MSNNQQESYEMRLEKALFIVSNPESLLTEENQSWLADSKNRQLYLQVLAIKEKALAGDKVQHFDTQAAWLRFSQVHPTLTPQTTSDTQSSNKLIHLFGNWRKWAAAAAISVPIILLASIAPIYHFTHKADAQETTLAQKQSQEQTSSHQTTDIASSDSIYTESEEEKEMPMESDYFHFENAPLEDIMKEVAEWYKMDVIFENEQARHLRFTFWASKQESATKTVELLNEMGKVKFTIKDNQIIIQ